MPVLKPPASSVFTMLTMPTYRDIWPSSQAMRYKERLQSWTITTCDALGNYAPCAERTVLRGFLVHIRHFEPLLTKLVKYFDHSWYNIESVVIMLESTASPTRDQLQNQHIVHLKRVPPMHRKNLSIWKVSQLKAPGTRETLHAISEVDERCGENKFLQKGAKYSW